MYYHVRVLLKEGGRKKVIDKSEDEIVSNYVNPFLRRASFWMEGELINFKNIKKFRVNRSKLKVKTNIGEAKKKKTEIPQLWNEIEQKTEEVTDNYLKGAYPSSSNDFESLLHPQIKESSYDLLMDGHLREAVETSIRAVFDFIRDRSGVHDKDGDRLIGEVFSTDSPILQLGDLDTEPGKDGHKGFIEKIRICLSFYLSLD